MFTPMHKILKPRASGDVRLEEFKISAEDSRFTQIRSVITRRAEEFVEAGTYCRLYVGQTLMMTDTQMEKRSNTGVVLQARGDVLIAGLGLGMILVPILAKLEVKSVTVIEKFKHVVKLVEPQLQQLPGIKKLKIVQANVFEWQPPKGQKWDVIYFDIWPSISEDNLPEMARLHQKYKSRKKPGAWMNSWKRDYLLHQRQQNRRFELEYGPLQMKCGGVRTTKSNP
jgi:spermidine synthase